MLGFFGSRRYLGELIGVIIVTIIGFAVVLPIMFSLQSENMSDISSESPSFFKDIFRTIEHTDWTIVYILIGILLIGFVLYYSVKGIMHMLEAHEDTKETEKKKQSTLKIKHVEKSNMQIQSDDSLSNNKQPIVSGWKKKK
jgi:beta-lactamase regulating signal transducer with metallopeptidase domain